MDNIYRQGFVDKCAAYGVDPEQLVKFACDEKGKNCSGTDGAKKTKGKVPPQFLAHMGKK